MSADTSHARLPQTLAAILLHSARRWPRKDALVIAGTRYTYEQLLRRILPVAMALRSRGLNAGDRIGLAMDNSAEYLELLLGAVLAGVVPVLFSQVTRGPHLRGYAEQLKVKLLFASSSFINESHEAGIPCGPLGDEPYPFELVQVHDASGGRQADYLAFHTSAEGIDPEELQDEVLTLTRDAPVVIIFTAAVTSVVPKISVLNNQDVVRTIAHFNARLKIAEGSRIWIPLHMFQIGFVAPLAAALATGAAVIAVARFEPGEALKTLKAEEVTHAYPVYPSYWLPIVYHIDFLPSDFFPLTHVSLLGPMALLSRAQKALPLATIMSTYGGAEMGGAISMPLDSDPADIRLGSVGRPYADRDFRIIDPDSGVACAAGDVGEIQIRATVPVPDAASQGSSFTADGWLRTSDLGAMTPEGILYFHGRLSDMLHIGGKITSALIIEAALSEHPAVLVAQVIAGNAGSAAGRAAQSQVPMAFVELRPGYQGDVADMQLFCRARLGSAQVPERIIFVDEWPMSASKIQKNLLAGLLDSPDADPQTPAA